MRTNGVGRFGAVVVVVGLAAGACGGASGRDPALSVGAGPPAVTKPGFLAETAPLCLNSVAQVRAVMARLETAAAAGPLDAGDLEMGVHQIDSVLETLSGYMVKGPQSDRAPLGGVAGELGAVRQTLQGTFTPLARREAKPAVVLATVRTALGADLPAAPWASSLAAYGFDACTSGSALDAALGRLARASGDPDGFVAHIRSMSAKETAALAAADRAAARAATRTAAAPASPVSSAPAPRPGRTQTSAPKPPAPRPVPDVEDTTPLVDTRADVTVQFAILDAYAAELSHRTINGAFTADPAALAATSPGRTFASGEVPQTPDIAYLAVVDATLYLSGRGSSGTCYYLRDVAGTVGLADSGACGPASAQEYTPEQDILAFASMLRALVAEVAYQATAGTFTDDPAQLKAIEPLLTADRGDIPLTVGIVYTSRAADTVYLSARGTSGRCYYFALTAAALSSAESPGCGPAAAQAYEPV